MSWAQDDLAGVGIRCQSWISFFSVEYQRRCLSNETPWGQCPTLKQTLDTIRKMERAGGDGFVGFCRKLKGEPSTRTFATDASRFFDAAKEAAPAVRNTSSKSGAFTLCGRESKPLCQKCCAVLDKDVGIAGVHESLDLLRGCESNLDPATKLCREILALEANSSRDKKTKEVLAQYQKIKPDTSTIAGLISGPDFTILLPGSKRQTPDISLPVQPAQESPKTTVDLAEDRAAKVFDSLRECEQKYSALDFGGSPTLTEEGRTKLLDDYFLEGQKAITEWESAGPLVSPRNYLRGTEAIVRSGGYGTVVDVFGDIEGFRKIIDAIQSAKQNLELACSKYSEFGASLQKVLDAIDRGKAQSEPLRGEVIQFESPKDQVHEDARKTLEETEQNLIFLRDFQRQLVLVQAKENDRNSTLHYLPCERLRHRLITLVLQAWTRQAIARIESGQDQRDISRLVQQCEDGRKVSDLYQKNPSLEQAEQRKQIRDILKTSGLVREGRQIAVNPCAPGRYLAKKVLGSQAHNQENGSSNPKKSDQKSQVLRELERSKIKELFH